MKHYFLVDFENVADAGLEGFFQLSAEDTVYLFYSPKANRINIDFIQKLLDGDGRAALRFLAVASGNQALDLQLASFLGSLISRGDQDCDYTIVSRDKGFACLRSFWSTHAGQLSIHQVSRIADARPEKAPAAKAEMAAPAPKAEPSPAPQKPVFPPKEPVLAPELPPAPAPDAAAPALPLEIGLPAEAAQEQAQKEKKPSAPVSQGKKAQPAGENPSSKAKQALNTSVQQALSKVKYEDKITNSVASLVSRSYGDKKIRQTVYRELIKLYGQKQGLEIYNQVKPLL